jgi:hypothetical protein
MEQQPMSVSVGEETLPWRQMSENATYGQLVEYNRDSHEQRQPRLREEEARNERCCPSFSALLFPYSQRPAIIVTYVDSDARFPTGAQEDELRNVASAIGNLRKGDRRWCRLSRIRDWKSGQQEVAARVIQRP